MTESTDPNNMTDAVEMARVLYEGTHGMTMNELTTLTGIPKRTLSVRARQEDWTKKLETKHGGATEEAIAAAEFFRRRKMEVAVATEETNDSVRVLTDPLPNEINELLERHRKEWVAPRAMSSEAVRMRDSDPIRAFERAKMAKITAETLKLVQEGERKAYGIDTGVEPPPGKHVVIIERD